MTSKEDRVGGGRPKNGRGGRNTISATNSEISPAEATVDAGLTTDTRDSCPRRTENAVLIQTDDAWDNRERKCSTSRC